MEEVNEKVVAALSSLGVPVARSFYQGAADAWITYEMMRVEDTAYHDDNAVAILYAYAADIFSRSAPEALFTQMKEALKSAGFYDVTLEADQYEADTGFYHLSAEFYYMEVL